MGPVSDGGCTATEPVLVLSSSCKVAPGGKVMVWPLPKSTVVVPMEVLLAAEPGVMALCARNRKIAAMMIRTARIATQIYPLFFIPFSLPAFLIKLYFTLDPTLLKLWTGKQNKNPLFRGGFCH